MMSNHNKDLNTSLFCFSPMYRNKYTWFYKTSMKTPSASTLRAGQIFYRCVWYKTEGKFSTCLTQHPKFYDKLGNRAIFKRLIKINLLVTVAGVRSGSAKV